MLPALAIPVGATRGANLVVDHVFVLVAIVTNGDMLMGEVYTVTTSGRGGRCVGDGFTSHLCFYAGIIRLISSTT
jgi:hypothetical protein